MPTSKLVAFLSLFSAALCWGLAPVATRELVTHLDPLHVLLLRFAIAALVFLPIFFRLRGWPRGDLLRMAGCALIAMGYYLPVTIGGRYIPSGVTGLLTTSQTLWMAALAVIFLRERLTILRIAGIALSTGGIVLLLGGAAVAGSPGSDLLLGGALTLFGSLMWSAYSLLLRPLAAKYGALPCTALTVAVGLLVLLPSINPALGAEVAAMTPDLALALILLAVCSTVIGNFFWTFGLARVTGLEAGPFLYLVPLISAVGGAALLGEPITPGMAASGLLIIGGMALAQVVRPRRMAAPNLPGTEP